MSESILTSLCFAHIRAAGAFFSQSSLERVDTNLCIMVALQILIS